MYSLYGIDSYDSYTFPRFIPAATVPVDARAIREFISLRDSVGLDADDRANISIKPPY